MMSPPLYGDWLFTLLVFKCGTVNTWFPKWRELRERVRLVLAGEDQVSGEWRKYDEMKVRNGRVKGQKKVVACNQATAKAFHILVEAMTRFSVRVKFGYFNCDCKHGHMPPTTLHMQVPIQFPPHPTGVHRWTCHIHCHPSQQGPCWQTLGRSPEADIILHRGENATRRCLCLLASKCKPPRTCRFKIASYV